MWPFTKKTRKDYLDPDYADLLEEARERFRAAAENEEETAQREKELDDLRFCESGSQWPEDIKGQREEEGRPCLEVDRITPFINQVCNEYRQARPQPQVNPVDDGASKETAEVLQGMIRHIMYQSNGDTAIDTAYLAQVRTGRGYVRVLTDYVDGESFEQEIRIQRVHNQHLVCIDPASTEPDGSDARYFFVSTDLAKEEYKQEYPDSKMSSLSTADWKSIGDDSPGWATKAGDACRVVEYFKKVKIATKLVRLEDGTVMSKSDYAKLDGVDGIPAIAAERDGYQEKVLWYKLNAVEVLDKTEWPGRWVPIVPFYGNELVIENKRSYAGLVRALKDPQRHYNYMKSAQAEAIALAPKSPIVAAKGSLGTGEMRSAWRNINKRPIAVAEYEHLVNGQPVPPPQRLSNEVNIQGITAALMGSVDDLKATAQMYDASLGNREANQSGAAIRQLQKQGSTGNYHYQDNAARSIRQLGRIIIDLIPKVYDTERMVRIVKPDDSVELVKINGPTGDKDKESGEPIIHNLKAGKYDVTVSVGPSYQTKRQENLAMLDSLLQGPMGQLLASSAGDLVVSMMDFQIAPQLQERLKKALPPEFQDKKEDSPQLPPEITQQMQQAQQVIDQLTEALNSAQSKIDAKTLELESRERIAGMQAQVELIKLKIQQEGNMGLAALQAELTAIGERLSILHQNEAIEQQPASSDAGETETAGAQTPEGEAA